MMPARIFSSVDLPAPFSPTSACASPSATAKRDAAQRLHGAERLVDVAECEAAMVASGATSYYGRARALRAHGVIEWTGGAIIVVSHRTGAHVMTYVRCAAALVAAAVLSQVPAGAQAPAPGSKGPTVTRASFGTMPTARLSTSTPSRTPTAIEVKAITYGGIITALKVPDRERHARRRRARLRHARRLPRRIRRTSARSSAATATASAKAQFTLDGKTYTLAANNGAEPPARRRARASTRSSGRRSRSRAPKASASRSRARAPTAKKAIPAT